MPMNLTEEDLAAIRNLVRVEVRQAIADMYHRQGYDRTSAAGAWQSRDTPRPLNEEWVHDRP